MALSQGRLWGSFSSNLIGVILKILVFVKAVPDTRISLELNEAMGHLRTEGLVMQWNPPDRAALETALRIKEIIPDTHITLVHLGPFSGERWIREGLALGSDTGIRIWDDGFGDLSPGGKAFLFSRTAEVLGFDLILTGDRSQDTGSGQVGALMAGQLGLPCITSVISLELEWEKRSIIARKVLSRGYEESIRCGLPLVVTMGEYPFAERDSSFPALLEALGKEILRWDLGRLGISEESLRKKEQRLTFSPLRFPRPRVRAIPAPDSSLPAFYRILKLLEGSVQRRGGKLIEKKEDELVEELFQTLRREGWLDHLRKEG